MVGLTPRPETTDLSEIPENPLLAGIAPEDWPEILAAGDRVHVTAGSAVFSQDEPADDFFVLLSGSVAVSVRAHSGEIPLAQLGPGAMLGEMCFLLGGTRSATVRAIEPCSLLRFANAAFQGMLDRHSPAGFQVLYNLAHALAVRLRSADSQLGELSKQLPPSQARRADLLRMGNVIRGVGA